MADARLSLGQIASDAHLVLQQRSAPDERRPEGPAIGSGRLPAARADRVGASHAYWLGLVLDVTPDVGTISAGDLVANPYIVGAPVPADRLVGRKGEDVVLGPLADLSEAETRTMISGWTYIGFDEAEQLTILPRRPRVRTSPRCRNNFPIRPKARFCR